MKKKKIFFFFHQIIKFIFKTFYQLNLESFKRSKPFFKKILFKKHFFTFYSY